MGYIGKLKLNSSDKTLIKVFEVAKKEALSYMHNNEHLGMWYDAANSERGFCIRNFCHESIGAQFLGLQEYTKNMLERFIEHVDEKRNWCSYWGINEFNKPSEKYYKSDEEFIYNLPGNFDLLNCCYRQYLWTGDEDYIKNKLFLKFYKITVTDYIRMWDENKDGLMEDLRKNKYRGIPYYFNNQIENNNILLGADMFASQYIGFLAYSEINRYRRDLEERILYKEKAMEIRRKFNSIWWRDTINNYSSFVLKDGKFLGVSKYEAEEKNSLVTPIPLYFNIVKEKFKIRAAIDVLKECKSVSIGMKSYYPEIMYSYGFIEEAYKQILELYNLLKAGNKDPEISYSLIGAIATGVFGINLDMKNKCIESTPKIPKHIQWATLEDIPAFKGYISLECIGSNEMILYNNSEEDIFWKASFKTVDNMFKVDDNIEESKRDIKRDGYVYNYIEKKVPSGEKCHIRIM